MNFTSLIVKAIGSLQHPSYLDLSDNGLTGEILKELCDPEKLVELYINTNSSKGMAIAPPKFWHILAIPSSDQIPAELGDCTDLNPKHKPIRELTFTFNLEHIGQSE
ncbi:hypothetical protein L1887_11616 [Cichorium endivia]|nr:hypothetical protein L1887_11616 [Cichorium endivia]